MQLLFSLLPLRGKARKAQPTFYRRYALTGARLAIPPPRKDSAGFIFIFIFIFIGHETLVGHLEKHDGRCQSYVDCGLAKIANLSPFTTKECSHG